MLMTLPSESVMRMSSPATMLMPWPLLVADSGASGERSMMLCRVSVLPDTVGR